MNQVINRQMDPFFKAISFYRRRAYDECNNQCTEVLQKNASHAGIWELKMRAMTMRVYVDDIEAEDGILGTLTIDCRTRCNVTCMEYIDSQMNTRRA